MTLQTEQINPLTKNIDQLPTVEMLTIMNAEDATVAKVVHDAIPAIAQAVDTISAQLKQGGHVIYVGAGSSGRQAMVDAAEWVPTYSVAPDLVQALLAGGTKAFMQSVEGAEDDRIQGVADLRRIGPGAQDVVVGIAASGYTPYVLGALDHAKERGLTTIGIACNTPSPLLDMVDVAIALPVGPEVITGSTRMKAGTAQKMVLNMLSTGCMIKQGKVYGNLMVDVKVTNEKLAHRARRIVAHLVGDSEDMAENLLARTGNQVKIAILVGRLGISPDEAQKLLAQNQGHLRQILDQGSP